MRGQHIVLVVITLFLVAVLVILNMNKKNNTISNNSDSSSSPDIVRYIPIGDSYTIGNGVAVEERWPNLLVRHLNEAGIKVKLIANPAVSGYTVQDAIERELPLFEKEKPDFATLFIGANDNFRGENTEIFKSELVMLIDRMQKSMTKPKNLVLITIPDYTKSVDGQSISYQNSIDTQVRLIQEYNNVIKEEAKKRDLRVVDLFPVSQTMTTSDLYISDGLHPSAKGIAIWEKEIYPVVYNLLKN